MSAGRHRHRIPRAKDWLPRKGSRHRAIPRSIQEGRQRGAVGIQKIFELPGAAEAESFFQEGYPDERLTLQPRQQAQARLSTGAGGLGLPSVEARRMSGSIRSKMGNLPEVLANLTGSSGDRVKRGLPEWRIIAQLGGNLREIRNTRRATKENIAVPKSWLEWGLGAEGDAAPRPPEVSAGHA